MKNIKEYTTEEIITHCKGMAIRNIAGTPFYITGNIDTAGRDRITVGRNDTILEESGWYDRSHINERVYCNTDDITALEIHLDNILKPKKILTGRGRLELILGENET